MSERLENAVETLKLARLIGLEADDLTFLESVPAAELRRLRESVTDSLFDAAGHAFGRLGAATKLLPSALVATIAERHFGPLLCARAAAAVEPAKAVDVARRLSPAFLADATIELDPRRVAAIISGVPTSLVGPVAAELGRRGEYVTMGRFLAFVPDASIAAAMAQLSDEAMLRTAFVLEHKEALDHAVGVLPPDRMPGVLRCASEQDLWPEALDLLDHLALATRGPIADIVATLDEPHIGRLVAAVVEKQLWENLLPIVAVMSPDARTRIAAMAVFHEPATLAQIVHAAAAAGIWADLLPLVDALPDETRALAANLIADRPRADIEALVGEVQRLSLWSTLLPVVESMHAESRERLATNESFHRPEILRAIIEAAASSGLWTAMLPLLSCLPSSVRLAAAEIIADLDAAVLTAAIEQVVERPEILRPLIELIVDIEPSERGRILALVEQTTPEVASHLVRAANTPGLRPLLREEAHADVARVIEDWSDRLGESI